MLAIYLNSLQEMRCCEQRTEAYISSEAPNHVGWHCDSAYASDESPTLKTNLRCDLCKKLHPERRVLPCEHWFCPPCLASVLPLESLTLSCPTCGEQSIVPEQGLVALPTTFLYQRKLYSKMLSSNLCKSCSASHDVRWKCGDCEDQVTLCTGCMQLHKSSELGHTPTEFDDQASECSSSRRASSRTLCDSHPGSLLMYYCTDCSEALCHKCQSESHIDHSLTTLTNNSGTNGHSGMLSDHLPPHMRAKWLDMQKVIDDCDSLSDSLSRHSSEEAEKICNSFNRLSKLLEQRKQILSSHLKETTERKTRAFAAKKLEVQKCMETEMKEAAKKENNTELDESSFPNLAALRKTINKMNVHSFGPQHLEGSKDNEPEDFPKYIAINEKSVVGLIGQMGKISSQHKMATTLEVKGDGLQSCCLNQKTTLYVTAKNVAGHQVSVDPGGIDAFITSKFGKKACNVIIKDGLINGSYDLSYVLRQEGLFLFSIKLYDQHISGSPFNLRCCGESEYSVETCSVHSKQRSFMSGRSSVASNSRVASKSPTSSKRSSYPPIEDDLLLKVGSRGRTLGQFTNPQGICTLSDGNLVVADSNNQNVQIFTPEGECILKFGSRGRGPGNMQRPTGVTALPNGNILVADYDNKWVSVFEPSGKYLGRFGAGVLLGPKGMAIDRDNHVILVDNKSSTIFVYDMHKFKMVTKFSSRGDKPHQLAGPHYVTVSEENHLYITDFHHHCVKVFDCTGKYLHSFGSPGEGNGQFNAPTGVTIDSHNNILVADWGNNRIQVLDSSGSFLSYVQSSGSNLYGPQGLCITTSGHVAVADSGNHCFKLYRYLT